MSAFKLLVFLVAEYVLFIVIGPSLFSEASPRPWVNDFVYPVTATLLFTAGGAIVLYLLGPPLWLVIVGFVVMFACSVFASIGGRFQLSSILIATLMMTMTFGVVLAAFLLFWSPPG